MSSRWVRGAWRSVALALAVCSRLGLAGCGSDDPDGAGGAAGAAGEPEVSGAFVVLAPDAHVALVQDFVASVGVPGAVVAGRSDPEQELARGAGAVRVAVVDDGRCAGCYRVDGGDGRYTVRAGGVLGVQYGLSELLEAMGVRFFHPSRTLLPATLTPPGASSPGLNRDHAPEMDLRGLHLHTLHPIEAYFDLWEPGEASYEGACRLIDWTVRNRGNYLQWPALDNIAKDEAAGAAWRAHTRRIVDYAHRRGVGVGLGTQLSGTSSLQKSLTLFKSPTSTTREQDIRDNLAVLTRDLPIDQINLSFGEFSKIAPQAFLDSVNLTRKIQAEMVPQATMSATIHVGNYPDLQISYQGESLLYYFLVKYADPSIVPWVHTVMYYNLFEDAGGSYLHDQFDLHRAYSVERLKAQQPLVYQPESAYWVAFDNSVPTYLPLYIRSRHLDVARLRAEAGTPLRQQVTFTSGWEWGYWQTDYATLRLSYQLPDDWRSLAQDMFAPWGDGGQQLASAINDLADVQHEALLIKRLAPYLAGRDFLIDLGEKNGKIAAPTRVAFTALAAMPEPDRAAFETSVLAPLETLAQDTEALRARAASAALAGAERFQAEVVDGIEVTARRAAFIAAAYRAALAHARGESPAGALESMDSLMTASQPVIDRRHADLHSPRGAELFSDRPNATLYAYGYLREANSLCFWRRERAQVRNLVLGEKGVVPGCVL